MGLSCQMLHVFDVNQADLEKSLCSVLSKRGYSLTSSEPVANTGSGPQVDSSNVPAYVIGPQLGRWSPVIDLYAEPWTGEICSELSRLCSSYVLSLMVFDDDVMLYNLDRNGISLDGYNSNLQYFENERLPESEIQSQRHTPEAFKSLLPPNRTLDDMLSILNAGWWQAHDSERLSDDGVMIDEDRDACPYESEGERMTAFGTVLELAGPDTEYPFANWRENKSINWSQYNLLGYSSKPSLLGRLFGKRTL